MFHVPVAQAGVDVCCLSALVSLEGAGLGVEGQEYDNEFGGSIE